MGLSVGNNGLWVVYVMPGIETFSIGFWVTGTLTLPDCATFGCFLANTFCIIHIISAYALHFFPFLTDFWALIFIFWLCSPSRPGPAWSCLVIGFLPFRGNQLNTGAAPRAPKSERERELELGMDWSGRVVVGKSFSAFLLISFSGCV